jgi:polar amino acid transport system ATP-binding protein
VRCERPVTIPITTPVLEAEGLVKRFGDHVVLSGVDLAVAEHEVVVLIGASGSGKSTLLRCVSLLEELDDGTVRLDGEEVTDPRADADRLRSRFGVVFQAFNLFPHLSVLQNVTLAPRVVHGVSRDEAEERAMRLLDRVGLAGKAKAYPDRLSGGQQQRVAIVRALANEPRMLLLDEVTSALDPELVGEVLRLVRELKDQGTTILMSTHEMAFARQVSDRVCFLDDGRLREQGPPEQVLADPREPRTRQFLATVIDAGRLSGPRAPGGARRRGWRRQPGRIDHARVVNAR